MSIRERSERFTEPNPKGETRPFLIDIFAPSGSPKANPRWKKVGLDEEIEIVEDAVGG